MVCTLGCSIISPLSIFVMRTHFSLRFWTLITNLILFFDYDVILRLHDALMTSRIVGITPNDAEYMISYLSSMHYECVSLSEKD